MSKKETLSKILKLKDNRKKELELEVKKAHDKAENELRKLEVLELEYSDNLDLFNEKNSACLLDADSLSSYYEFFTHINARIVEQKRVYMKYLADLEFLKGHLIEAHKEKKIFEIMKDKEVKKEFKEIIDKEQKEADFFSVTRRLR